MAIDLNSDLGEGIGEVAEAVDAELLGLVSSANVACGGHAGDEQSMARVCRIAAEHRVAIGAHISYADREGFGRQPNAASSDELRDQLLSQLWALETAAHAAGSAVTYIKPHGALYHACLDDAELAQTVVDVALAFRKEIGRSLAMLSLPGSALLTRAEAAGLRTAKEAFADRAYAADGRLVPRTEPGSVITDPTEALTRLKRLLRDSQIIAIDGTPIDIDAHSICVHGDTPGAVFMARRLRAAIDADRVRIAPFAPPPHVSAQPSTA